MAVGQPDKLAPVNRVHLLGGYFMRAAPASKIGASRNPRICHEDGAAIVTNQRRVTNRFEADIHRHCHAPTRVCASTIREVSESRSEGVPSCAPMGSSSCSVPRERNATTP